MALSSRAITAAEMQAAVEARLQMPHRAPGDNAAPLGVPAANRLKDRLASAAQTLNVPKTHPMAAENPLLFPARLNEIASWHGPQHHEHRQRFLSVLSCTHNLGRHIGGCSHSKSLSAKGKIKKSKGGPEREPSGGEAS